jgi:serine/threonine-protein kinase
MNCPRCHAAIESEFKACPHCGEIITDFLRRYLTQPIDGKYEIIARLGTGGMGEVYKVRHTYLGALRVIKVIRPQIAENKDANDRFLREAQLATKVHHQNVATLHDYSALPDGSFYMVWEFIDGENLGQRMRLRGTLPARTAVLIAIDALHGLDAIHKAGIVHRDISPENLMLAADGLKIIDLGVAKGDEVDGGTKTGIFVGKLRYASPEQLGFLGEGEKIDGRADLYSLAIVLYEMLTGRPPFEAKSPHEYVLMHSREVPPRPMEITQNLPGGGELQRILQRALESDRTKRFQNATEFAAALEAIAKSLPDPELTKTRDAAFDAETTMRVSRTLPQQAINDSVAPTLRTPLPGGSPLRATVSAPSVTQTVATAAPATTARTAAPPAGGKPRIALIAAIAIVLVLAGAGAALLFTRGRKVEEKATATAPPATAKTVSAQPQPAQSTVDVTTTSAAPTATTAAATATVAPPAPRATAVPPRPAVRQTETPRVETAEEKPKKGSTEPALPLLKYGDGQADTGSNDAALRQLREQLAGVKTIALRGGESDLLNQLSSSLKDKVTIASNADVTIDFNGRLERLGRGRKRRSATVTISKHGHAFFQYELPPEEYRVGDNPAEAFSRVLKEALQ